jgi:hypothetical protein
MQPSKKIGLLLLTLITMNYNLEGMQRIFGKDQKKTAEKITEKNYVRQQLTCLPFTIIYSTLGLCFFPPLLDENSIILYAPANIFNTIQIYVVDETLYLISDQDKTIDTSNVQVLIGLGTKPSLELKGSGKFRLINFNLLNFALTVRDTTDTLILMDADHSVLALYINGYDQATLQTQYVNASSKKPSTINRHRVFLNDESSYVTHGVISYYLELTTLCKSKAFINARNAFCYASGYSEQMIHMFPLPIEGKKQNCLSGKVSDFAYVEALGQVDKLAFILDKRGILNDLLLACDKEKRIIRRSISVNAPSKSSFANVPFDS